MHEMYSTTLQTFSKSSFEKEKKKDTFVATEMCDVLGHRPFENGFAGASKSMTVSSSEKCHLIFHMSAIIVLLIT